MLESEGVNLFAVVGVGDFVAFVFIPFNLRRKNATIVTLVIIIVGINNPEIEF